MGKDTTFEKNYIYFITDGDNVKIGSTHDLKRRLSSLQTGNSKKLTILDYIEAPRKTEKEIHMYYKKYHVRGEWFNILALYNRSDILREDRLLTF